MANSMSVSQILYNQARQKRELEQVRKELAMARDNDVLDAEIRRMNRSPYVEDRPYHKVRMLKGSQEEQDWKKKEVSERVERYVEEAPRIEIEKLQLLRQHETQARVERLTKNSRDQNLKKLDII